jgi:hypothetical protein
LSLLPSTNTDFYIYHDYKIDEYNDAINSSIREAADMVEVTKTNSSLVATGYMTEYIVPSGANIERILDVFYIDDDNYDYPVKVPSRTWITDMTAGVMTLRFTSYNVVPEGKTIRIFGMGNPTELDDDTDILDNEMPVEYVVNEGAYMLKMSHWRASDPLDSPRAAMAFSQKADGILRRYRPVNRRGSVKRRF